METKIYLIAILSGAILAFALPPFLSGFIAYFALVPLMFLLRGTPLRWSIKIGFLWGLGFNSFSLYWIAIDTIPGGIAAILFLSFLSIFFPVIYSFGYRIWGERFVWAFPFLWVLNEYLRYFGQLRFPWLTLAHTQTYYPSLIQYCSYTGVCAVSFWICLLNVIIYLFIHEGRRRSRQKLWASMAAILIILPYFYGKIVIDRYRTSEKSIKIALIQGNIDPWAKWDKEFKDYNFKQYEDLSLKAAHQKPDLMIWPESAATSYLLWDDVYLSWVHRIVDSLNIPLLTGALDTEFEKGSMARKDYNSALFLQPHSEKVQSYAKILLVPVSERFPFVDYLPFLAGIDLGQGPSNFTPGTEFTTFNYKQINFATVICFESIFPGFVRKLCNKSIDFLVVITNDGWFGNSSSPFQHSQFAVFRAIENRISIARCANTGISSFINPLGEVLEASPLFETAVNVRNIPLRQSTTFYARHGDWFPLLISSIGGIIILLTFIRKGYLFIINKKNK
ncbi:MAG: apolipoprotein N-acyltransferase [Patescibacteria group bacterium]|nr:apolipoprotein N-acyltransferase [Patescibacteria group bacterium]